MRRWIYGREVDKASGEREDEEEKTRKRRLGTAANEMAGASPAIAP
jgi:hypothetical protein